MLYLGGKVKYLIAVLILFMTVILISFNKTRIIKDVLFINGSESTKRIQNLFSYRVLNQMEQLKAGFLESNTYSYDTFEPTMVLDYRVIIFYLCPLTEKVNEAISLAKNLNKKVIFDIDNLLFDTKYTNVIPFIKSLSMKEKQLIDDKIIRIGKTLKLCDVALTTTKSLAKELKNYISIVFINSDVVNEEMWKLSQNILKSGYNKKIKDHIIIGYWSDNIAFNSDFDMIKPVLLKILKEFKNVEILLIGEINFAVNYNEFQSQIIYKKVINWKKLPQIISNADIILAPLEKNIFNTAKSEIKWVEAALVKVPTVASNFGIFKQVIKHKETGLLCSDLNDWYISLKNLINNENFRRKLGENAYKFCKDNYNTLYTANYFANFINSISNKHIGFFLPKIVISGGIYVILKHACILKDNGYDVDLIVPEGKTGIFEFQNHKFNIINFKNEVISSQYDIIVATFYSTLFSSLNYYKTKKHLYLVQGYETDFYQFGDSLRSIAEKTYSVPFGVEYITISKWCEHWLWKKYKKKSRYAPNGIDTDNFTYYKRNLNKKKIRILIEGDCNSYIKNVDESFKIIEKLDKDKFEVWYLSYRGKPKKWYRYDKFFHKVQQGKVNEIYYKCDILIKSSLLESFSYPPLEMLATGGYCIVAPNGGNKEYLKDGENCLLYKLGDINSGVKCIQRLINDKKLQKTLYENGIATAKKYDWKNLKNQILSLYDT